MPQVASKEEIEQIIDSRISKSEEKLMQAIRQIGKTARMTTDEVAEEWGVCSKTAIKRLKKMYRQGRIQSANFDSRPITVDRQEFIEAISTPKGKIN